MSNRKAHTPIDLPLTALAVDVGGTNLSLALMSWDGTRFGFLKRASYGTLQETSLLEPVLRFLADCRAAGLPAQADAACLSGAGPVKGRRIILTNVPWDIDGDVLEAALGMPVRVINDFEAIGHGVLLLEPEASEQLRPLPHLDGSLPQSDPHGTILVVGAGTGLGVGYILRDGTRSQVLPSEGGHIGLPMIDEETLELWRFLRPSYLASPGAESAVSGPGLARLLEFMIQTHRAPATAITRSIQALPMEARPAAISENGGGDEACSRALNLFVDLYARVCAELCTVFLPTGGLYLAGGIAAKNEARFLDENRFMASFSRNPRTHINTIVAGTPVYLVRDYSISLFGAARAACQGIRHEDHHR